MLVYVPQRRSPAAARTWLLFIFLLPWPGVLVYAVIGRIKLPAWRLARQRQVSRLIREWQATHPVPLASVRQPGPVAELVHSLGDFRAMGGNAIEILPEYDASITRLVGDIDGARQLLHLLYCIFADDDRGAGWSRRSSVPGPEAWAGRPWRIKVAQNTARLDDSLL